MPQFRDLAGAAAFLWLLASFAFPPFCNSDEFHLLSLYAELLWSAVLAKFLILLLFPLPCGLRPGAPRLAGARPAALRLYPCCPVINAAAACLSEDS